MKHTISDRDRNWFGTCKGCQDANDFDELVKLGFAEEHKPPSWSGDTALYSLTKEGKKIVSEIELEEFKSRPKITKSKRRYAAFLSLDLEQSFGGWLKDSYWNDYRSSMGV